MTTRTVVVIQGVERLDQVPGIEAATEMADLRCANDVDRLRALLPDAEALLGWNFRGGELEFLVLGRIGARQRDGRENGDNARDDDQLEERVAALLSHN